MTTRPSFDTAILAGGCFWCVEAVYQPLAGVISVESGYTGDSAETAFYETVCSGLTEHAEAVRIEFDPQILSYEQLLDVFFLVAHDPTQKDRQGNDRGRQYRSAIFYLNETQRRQAEEAIRRLDQRGAFDAPIATELAPLMQFYPAEAYHQDYASRHPDQPYIARIAQPKVNKLQRTFPRLLRTPNP